MISDDIHQDMVPYAHVCKICYPLRGVARRNSLSSSPSSPPAASIIARPASSINRHAFASSSPPLPLWSRGTSHEARATSHEARATRHEARATRHEPRGTRHEPRGTRHEARGTKHEARGTKHEARGKTRAGMRHEARSTKHETRGTRHEPRGTRHDKHGHEARDTRHEAQARGTRHPLLWDLPPFCSIILFRMLFHDFVQYLLGVTQAVFLIVLLVSSSLHVWSQSHTIFL